MRYSSLVFLCTILSSSIAFTADSLNVALSSRVTVQYAVNDPEFLPITNADPMKMVDNNTSTFYNLPVGQEGTTFLFDLGAEHQISTFIARAFASITNFRLRGYGLEGSADGVQWTTMAQDTNQLLATAVVTLTPTPTRYIRLTVTRMDPTRPNGVATILSEIQLWAPIDRPTIVGVSLSATSGQGIRFQDIQWSSFLMDSTNTVDISYRAAGLGTPEIPIASSVPNTKLYSWETALVPDGSYAIIVRPKPSGMAGSGTGVVANFPNFAAFVIDESTEWSRAISGPWGFSKLLGDTIKLQWKCSPRIPREQSFAISYSMDSATTWIPLTVVADSSARSAKIPMPVGSSTSPTAFFRVGAVVDGIEYAAVRTQRPIVLSLPPEQLTTKWSHAYAYRNSDAQGSSSLRGGFNAYEIDGQAVRILTGGLPYGPTGPLGDPYGSGPAMTVSSAVADMDGDGPKEVSPGGSIARDDGSRYSVPSVQFPIMSGGVLMADVAGDHKLELILTLRGSIEVRNDTFALVNRVVFPTPAYAGVQSCAGDIDGDGVNEIVYAMQDRLYAIKANGDLIPGFPRQFSENMVGWVVLADLDRTGRPQIVTGTTSHLYCIKGDGSIRPGFPIVFLDYVQPTSPAVADMDGDGYLDIIFLTRKNASANTKGPLYQLRVIDRNGVSLTGWPAEVDANTPFVRRYAGDTTSPKPPEFFNGWLSSPLVASIDGDRTPEVVLTGNNGFLYVYNSDGTSKSGYPVYAAVAYTETGVLGDFDHDGTLNMVLRWKRFEVNEEGIAYLDFGPSSYNPECIPWPMLQQNSARTGIAPLPQTAALEEHGETLPASYALEQNYPNPFNPSTVIRYALPKEDHVRLTIFDALGREVEQLVDGQRAAGTHSVEFQARTLASGMYFCRLETGGRAFTMKMMLLR